MTRIFRAPFLALAVSCAFAGQVLAQDVSYNLFNETSSVLMEMYTSPAGDTSWGEDILGMNVLGAGESATVLIADGQSVCVYDLLFVFDDETELTDTVDICELGSYTLTE